MQPWLVALVAIFILILRRKAQITHPALWVEEGSQFLHQYLEKGWLYIFEPVNGYLIVPAKLVQLLALHVSFVDLPFWTVVFTLLLSGLVAAAITAAPINIRFRFATGLAPFLIPIHPEPMAVGEYAFWFVGLLSIVALLWRTEEQFQWPRYAYAAAGAISSPLAVLVTPLMIGRAVRTRSHGDIVTAAISTCLGSWQAWLVLGREELASGSAQRTSAGEIPLLIEKFVGDYFVNADDAVSLIVGIVVVLMILLLCGVTYRAQKCITPIALLVCFGLSVLASIMRVNVQDIDAVSGAPRYFFYPFTLLAWTLLSLATGSLAQRLGMVAAASIPLLQVLSPWYQRLHDVVDWRGGAIACMADAPPPVPQVLSVRPNWQPVLGEFKLDGQFLQPGIVTSLGFANPENAVGSGLTGDAAVGSAKFEFSAPSRRYLAVQLLTGPDATGQAIEVTAGSESQKIDLAPLTAQLKGGWTYVLLPAAEGATALRLIDGGTGWGQWSAMGEVLGADAMPGEWRSLYALPVHYDGFSTNRWRVDLTHEDCRRLSARAILDGAFRR